MSLTLTIPNPTQSTERSQLHAVIREDWKLAQDTNFPHGLKNVKTLKASGLDIGFIELYTHHRDPVMRLVIYNLKDEILVDTIFDRGEKTPSSYTWLVQDVTRLLKRMCFDIISGKYGEKHQNHLSKLFTLRHGILRNYNAVINILAEERYPIAPEFIEDRYPIVNKLEKILVNHADSTDLLVLPKDTNMRDDFELYRAVGEWLNKANNQNIFNNGKLSTAMMRSDLGKTHPVMTLALDHYLRRNPKGLWATHKGTGASFVKLTTIFLKSSFSTPAAANASWLNVLRAFDLLRLNQIEMVDKQTAGKELAELLTISENSMVSGIQMDIAPITQHRIRYLFTELLQPYLISIKENTK